MPNVEGLTRDNAELMAALGGYASLMCEWQEYEASYRVYDDQMLEAERKAWERLETIALMFIDDLGIFLDKRRALRRKLFDSPGQGAPDAGR